MKPITLERIIAYSLETIMVAGLVFAIIQKDILNSFLISVIILLTLIPTFFRKKYKIFIPTEFNIAIILFIFAALFLGEINDYYTKFWWWDIILHISSGLLFGIVGFFFVYLMNKGKKVNVNLNPFFIALFAWAFSMAIGSAWEIFEFVMDSFFSLNMQKSGLIDTMWDLIVNAGGGFIISSLGFLYLTKKVNSPTYKFIEKIIKRNKPN